MRTITLPASRRTAFEDAVGASTLRLSEATAQFEAAGKSFPKGTIGFVEGVASQGGVINANRRLYSAAVLAEAAQAAEETLIPEGLLLGEVDHPGFFDEGGLGEAAVRFTKMFMEGDLLKYEGVILSTAHGQHLRSLLDGGVKPKVSTRGFGPRVVQTLVVDGVPQEVEVITSGFRLEGVDFVVFPSNPAARNVRHEDVSKEERMTLEALRAAHPELLATVEAAAREGWVAETVAGEREAAAREAGVVAGREEGRTAALAEDTVVARDLAVSAIVEALRPLVPELAKATTESGDAALAAQVTTLREELAAAKVQIADAAQVAATAEAARVAEQAKTTVAARVAKVLEGFEDAEMVRPILDEATTVEQVDALFAREKARMDVMRAKFGGAKGGGAGDTPGSTLTPQQEEEKKMAAQIMGTAK